MQTAPSDVNFTYKCRQLKYSTKTPYPQSRSKHAACVHDGYLYLSAGKDGNVAFRDLWRCQLDTWKWEKVSFRGNVQSHLEGHTLVSCKKVILLFGGEFGDALTEASLWIINPDLGYVHQCTPDPGSERPCVRRYHSAVVYDGCMFVYGGYVDIKGSSSELWQFRIDDEEWELVSPRQPLHDTPGCRHGHTAVVYKKCMWLFGGMTALTPKQDIWCYSFAANRWERVKVKYGPPHLTGHSAVVVQDKMLVFGGENNREPVNQLWAFSFCTEKWSQILLNDRIPSPCTFHASVFVTKSPRSEASVKASSMPFLQKKLNNLHLDRPRSSPASALESQRRSCNDEMQLEKSLSPKCLNKSLSPTSLHNLSSFRPIPPQTVNLCINSDSQEKLKVLPAPNEYTEDRSPLVPKKIDFNYTSAVQLNKCMVNGGLDNPGVSHSTEELIRDSLQQKLARLHDSDHGCDTDIPNATFDRSVSHIEKPPYKPFIRQSSDIVIPLSSQHSDLAVIGDIGHVTEDGFRAISAKRCKFDPELFLEDLEFKECLTHDIAIQYPSSRSAFKPFRSTESLLEADSRNIETIELSDLGTDYRESPRLDIAAQQRNKDTQNTACRQLSYKPNVSIKSLCDISQNAQDDNNTCMDNRTAITDQNKSNLYNHDSGDRRQNGVINGTGSGATNGADINSADTEGSEWYGGHDEEAETSFQSQCFPTARQRSNHSQPVARASKPDPAESSYMLILGGKEVQGTNFSIKPIKMWKLEVKPC